MLKSPWAVLVDRSNGFLENSIMKEEEDEDKVAGGGSDKGRHSSGKVGDRIHGAKEDGSQCRGRLRQRKCKRESV